MERTVSWKASSEEEDEMSEEDPDRPFKGAS
jgi:hypothetical protein